MPLPSNVRYLFADTETTGVNADDKVVEIGWIETDENFNEIARFESLIDPQRLVAPEASAVHGLTNADLEHAPTIEEFFSEDAEGCYGKLIEEPVVLIGHRIGFDHRFLKPFITNVVQELCTLRWIRKLYPDMGNHQLQTAIFALNLPRSEGAHRVMADVLTAFHLTQHLCERTGLSLRQLTEASYEPFPMATMPFGKHKGQPIDSVPPGYLRWMLKEMQLDMDLQFSVEQALNYKKNKNERTEQPSYST